MDPKRRYSEDEVARIFERATTAEERDARPLSADGERGTGLTLPELREIGREVGIPAEKIDRAAAALDGPDVTVLPRGHFLGVPISVGRTVYLDRRLTDEEWGRLVVDLRETFEARGRIREEGPFRSWNNGNLQALLEPTQSGERLRLRTLKSSGRPSLAGGAAMLAAVPALLVFLAVTGVLGDPGSLELPLILGVVGAVLYGNARISLPRWAETRELQMKGVADRLQDTVAATDHRALRDESSEAGPA